MDIALNIQSDIAISQKNKKSTSKVIHKNAQRRNASNLFSFTFEKNKKVKAVVARRKTVANKVKLTAAKRNYVLLQPNTEIDNESDCKSDIDLEINVSHNVTPHKLVERKPQISTEERLNKNKDRKKSNQDVKVLTQEEINIGIKKFSNTVVEKNCQRKDEKHILKRVKSGRVSLFKNNPETKIIGQRLVKPFTEKIFTGAAINSLGLHPHCVKNLSDILQITELTAVQQKAIPKALEGRDLLIRSQTGSGKTLAYALPIVEKLQEIRPKLSRESGIQAVIIVPTRELAVQTYELFLKVLKPYTWIVPGILMGGEKRKSEKARLRKGINILVGTPGRLCDHLLHTETFKLDKSKFLVLDEADKLLELGYERDVKKIVEAINEHKLGILKKSNTTPGQNPFKTESENIEIKVAPNGASDLQRLLLSATLTSSVQMLAGLTLKNPLFIDTSDSDNLENIIQHKGYDDAVQKAVEDGKLVIPATVQLSYVVTPPKLRLVTLCGILAKEQAKGKLKALVFMSTMEMVDFHHALMMECLTQKILDDEEESDSGSDTDEDPLLRGVSIFKLHGSMTQQERSGVFNAFRSCKSGVMVATDVIGRGIDIAEVNLVVQYSPPQQIAEFVHRVGRTARAGRSGQAVLFITPNEVDFVKALEDKRIRISQGNMEDYLYSLIKADPNAKNTQEAASNLQHKFELFIEDDKEMFENACRAFMSWVRSYSTFPKELKEIFNIKNAHMGHYAKSFGLSDPPKSFAKKHTKPKPITPSNRLTYSDRDHANSKEDHTTRKRPSSSVSSYKLNKYVQNSSIISTSEFDSGLGAIKKRRKR